MTRSSAASSSTPRSANQRVGAVGADALQRLLSRSWVLQGVLLGRSRLHHHRADRVGDDGVQLAGDPGALVDDGLHRLRGRRHLRLDRSTGGGRGADLVASQSETDQPHQQHDAPEEDQLGRLPLPGREDVHAEQAGRGGQGAHRPSAVRLGDLPGCRGAFAHTVFGGISMLELVMAVEVHRSDLWALEAGSGQSGKVTVPSATRTAGPDSSTR